MHTVIVRARRGLVTEVLIDNATVFDVESVDISGLNGPGPVRVKIEVLARDVRVLTDAECLTSTPEKAMIVTP